MNCVGMMVDVFYVGEKSFYDVLVISGKLIVVFYFLVCVFCDYLCNLMDD